MSSRKRVENPDNLQPDMPRQYQLRSRRVGVPPSSSVSTFTSETDPLTPEPEKKDKTVEQNEKSLSLRRTAKSSKYEGSSGDISDFIRPSIRNSGKEKKEDTAEQNVRSLRTTRFSNYKVTPESDEDSNEGSEYSNSSGRGSPEKDRSSESSEERQPSQPRQPRKHTDGDEKETRQYQHKIVSVKKSSLSQARKLMDYTNDDKDKTKYYRGEDASFTYFPKAGSAQHSYFSPEDRGKESFLYQRHQQTPQEFPKFQADKPRSQLFSDDDEGEENIRKQRALKHNLTNHYPVKKNESKGTCMIYLFGVLLLLLLGSAAVYYKSPESIQKVVGLLLAHEPQVKKDLKDDFKKLGSVFTNQSPLMLNRSRLILERHLGNWKENTEPAIILLTGAKDAEQTLLCLGTQLANIYSSACNGSHMVISGSDWASKSNEEVKERIDDMLSAGFQATTRAAVLHRLEVLPAGSLLILYKYCDHESAMYKNVALVLTVLLEDPTLSKEIPLADLEEKVRAFLIQKLTNSQNKATHDSMDNDKFSGVWSRISHVVLPVFPEQNADECAK